MTNMSMMVTENPNKGDTSSERPMSCAFDQFTAVSLAPGRSEKATPTPRIEPISVCELEQGMRKYHVNRLQTSALVRSAITMDRHRAIDWATSHSNSHRV